MVETYGKWPGVAAIVGDADMWCIPCARLRYGGKANTGDAVPGYEKYTDFERNPLTVVLSGSPDLHTQYCGRCLVPLCADDCVCYQSGQAGYYQQHGEILDVEQDVEGEEEIEYEDVRDTCVGCSRRTNEVCFSCGSPLCWMCDDRFGCPVCR